MNFIPSLPYPRFEAESSAIGPVLALVSIGPSLSAPSSVARPSIPKDAYPALLRLAFDDVPQEVWIGRDGTRWMGPKEEDLLAALDFARPFVAKASNEGRGPGDPPAVAVHCEQGRSRSAAIALAICAEAYGPGREADAVRAVLSGDVDGRRCFNPFLVRAADRILDRKGRLEEALAAACRPYRTWTAYWRREGAEF